MTPTGNLTYPWGLVYIGILLVSIPASKKVLDFPTLKCYYCGKYCSYSYYQKQNAYVVRDAKSKAVLHRYFSNELPEDNKKKPAPKKSKSEDKQVKRFTPPTLEEVKAYCAERNNTVDAEQNIHAPFFY